MSATRGRRIGFRAAGFAFLLAVALPGGPGALAQSSAAESGSIELPGGITLPAGALASPGDRIADDTELRLVAGVGAVGDLGEIPAGLAMRLAPGWKTYWRSPGDAGYPVSVDWSGSQNLASADFAWPAPHRFTLFGLDTFGYADEVVFPISLEPERAGEPVRVVAQVSYLVCKEVCIPGEARLSLDLPAGPALPTADLQAIDRFASQVPDDGSSHGLALERVVATDGDAPLLEVTVRSDFPFQAPDVIVEGPPGLHFAAPEVRLAEGGRLATMTLRVTAEPEAPPLTETRLTLTVVDAAPSDGTGAGGAGGYRGLEQTLTPAAAPRLAVGGLLSVLGLALLGGLILNLMPCVLPVLSLKLLGVVGHGGGEVRAVRASFLASAAGVIFAFLVLAAALAAVKAAGVAVGWGIQFQQPWFLAVMLLLLTLFACNLWGWFEISLPGWLGRLAARGSGAGRAQQSLAGHFATGAFATLLATPCSAPFLGTAVGFALAGTTADLFAVFLALGLGLALPYLLVAALPGIATMLPRPGAWMATLRRILGVALAVTALWLLSVLAAQLGGFAAVLAGLLLVAIAGALWLRRRLTPRLDGPATTAVVVSALAMLLLVGAPPQGAPNPVLRAPAWEAFDEAAIGRLVAEGKVVFVDVTADWCITCQVNKKLVLEDGEVAMRLRGDGIVAMQADWTRPDDGIARYLASFGRYGIPFNAVYGPGAPQGLALPELLSRDAVLDALSRVAGPDGGNAQVLSSSGQ
jgi:suppressor for copper-sensitivity B